MYPSYHNIWLKILEEKFDGANFSNIDRKKKFQLNLSDYVNFMKSTIDLHFKSYAESN